MLKQKNEITIELLKEQHHIEGDRYHAFLHQGQKPHANTIALATDVTIDEYLSLTEKLSGLKIRLETLGNSVKTVTKEIKDPNFESADAAAEYMDNK